MTNRQMDVALQAFKLLCDDVGSSFSRRLLGLCERHDFEALTSVEIDPSEYSDHAVFRRDYMLYAYIRKYTGFPVTTDLVAKAKFDFENVEAKVLSVNRDFRSGTLKKGVDRYIFVAARKISHILGPFTYAKVLPGCEWGTGATATLKRASASVEQKILEPRLSVTGRCLAYARAYLEHDIHWTSARFGSEPARTCPLASEFNILESGRFATVPKTVKSLRAIDIQPTLNLFFQKGVGKFIRRQLQKNGIDLDDQSRNQMLASVASRDALSTIDLASASDTISHEIVKALLPHDWYCYLNDLRTHSIRIDGRDVRLEKFSAMGNGFTFELESLIFYALCESVVELDGAGNEVVSVYGDDIIVSRSIANKLIWLLEAVGFSVNVDKTFIDGRFFESCGKHYFDGFDVTPVYQKEVISDLASLLRAANRLLLFAIRCGENEYIDTRYRRTWSFFKSLIPSLDHRIDGPVWLDGDGFLKNPYYRPKVDIHGTFRITELQFRNKKRRLEDSSPLLATSLRKGVVVETPFYGLVPVVGSVRTLRATRRVSLMETEVPVWGSSFRLLG